VCTKTFDLLDLEELDEDFERLGFTADYEICPDGLLKITVKGACLEAVQGRWKA